MALDIEKSVIERIRVECPVRERDAALEYIEANRYRIVMSGPKLLDEGRCDPTIYMCIAERTRDS